MEHPRTSTLGSAGIGGTSNAADIGPAARLMLSELFDREFDAVYRFCLTRTGSHTAAEDAASDVFTEAARRFAATPPPEIDIAWLITVARRRIIDRWRSEERHRARVDRVKLLAGPDLTIEDPGSAATAGEVIDALGRLPARQRIAITLRYVDGFSVTEVAAQLDTTYAATESLLSRGRAGLLNTLEAMS